MSTFKEPLLLLVGLGLLAYFGVGAGRVIERGADEAHSDSKYSAKPEACEGRLEN